MDYVKQYDFLISKAKNRVPLDGYVERHHVLPKSLGGNNQPENIVILTAREHFVAHLLLAKIHGGKMLYAAVRMSNTKRYNSRRYEWLRKKHSIEVRRRHIGKKPSLETRRRMSEAAKARKSPQKTCMRVNQFRLTGEFIAEFSSQHSAARSNNIPQSHINSCVNGKRKTAGGYIWKAAP